MSISLLQHPDIVAAEVAGIELHPAHLIPIDWSDGHERKQMRGPRLVDLEII